MGLHLNREKSLLFIPLDGNDSLNNTITNEIPVSRVGFELLGCPIRSQVFFQESLMRRIVKVRRVLGAPARSNAQMEMDILRSCLSLTKL